MSYTGYLITSAKLDLNWWLSLSQCPRGRQQRDQKLWKWEGGFSVPRAAQVSEHSHAAQGLEGRSCSGGKDGPSTAKICRVSSHRGVCGEGNPCKQSHISSPSATGSSASAAHPDSAAGSQGWFWSSMFVPTCLKQFLVFMADAEPKIRPTPSQLALL